MILRSVSDCSVPLSLLIVIFLSSLNYFFYLLPPSISLYSFPLPPTSSTSLYSVNTLVFPLLPSIQSSSYFSLFVILLLLFCLQTHLPLSLNLSSYVPLCTLLSSRPFPSSSHPHIPRYPCCFAAISHFNLGTSSHLLESNKTSTAVKTDRPVGRKIGISVVRLTRDVKFKTIRGTRETRREGQKQKLKTANTR